MKYLRKPSKPVNLPARGTFPEAAHLFDRRSVDAINAALASGRPLLVRGEPGTGKSQLARAAAEAFRPKRAFLSFVVDARTESRDLHFSFDAVARLADAQSGTHKGDLGMDHYVAPGPLWWIFDPYGAKDQRQSSRSAGVPEPVHLKSWTPEKGMVLLIDEIDKADASVPNGLLEGLGQGRFDLPGGTSVKLGAAVPNPLVIITTNEERTLPDPFLRRCLVLQLDLPTADDDLIEELIQRGRAHFDDLDSDILDKAATQLVADRNQVASSGACPPGCAEYIDLLRALCNLAPGDAKKQSALLGRIGDFVLRKHPERPRL